MANTKISQLPLYSGSAADLRWFVMNNSGETETFKFSGYTSPYKPATQPNSVISDYSTTQPLYPYTQVLGGSGNTFTSQANTFVSLEDFDTTWAPVGNYHAGLPGVSIGNKNSSLAGGVNIGNYNITNTSNSDAGTFINNISGNIYGPGLAVVIGCNVPNLNINGGVFLGVYQPVVPSGAIRTVMIGGYSNTKNNDGDINTIFNSSSCTIGGTTNWAAIYNSNSSSILGGGSYNAIFNGNTHSITSSSYSTIVGGEQNTLNSIGYGFIGGGKFNILSGGTNYSSIIGGVSNENYGNYSGIFNGTLNKINNTATEHSTIIGSYSSTTEGDYSHIFGGLNNQIFNQQAVIVGGANNIITAGCDNDEMFGSRNSVISGNSVDTTFVNTIDTNSGGYDRIVMLGTSGRTATTDTATFVENLVVFNYTGLNFADDTAAAAGGVVLGQVYHNNGALRIRIV
jgi:hypothetical protein